MMSLSERGNKISDVRTNEEGVWHVGCFYNVVESSHIHLQQLLKNNMQEWKKDDAFLVSSRALKKKSIESSWRSERKNFKFRAPILNHWISEGVVIS